MGMYDEYFQLEYANDDLRRFSDFHVIFKVLSMG